jgi:amino acid adenylation domain-containing protein
MAQELLLELHQREIRLRLTAEGRLDVVAPPGALTPELREKLRLHRNELIDLLRRSDGTGDRLVITPDAQHRYDPFPLTDIQHAYWIGRHAPVELGGVSCHYYTELDSTGLDIDRLTIALRNVITRHEMLRAVVDRDGRQRIRPDVPDYVIAETDLRDLSDGERAKALAATTDELSHQVTPADRWPLFEIRANRLDDTTLRLYVSIDVLILDGLSLNLFFRDWRRFYEQPDLAVESPPVSYRDYVLAEAAARDGRRYAEARRYWQARLDTIPPAPALPLAISPTQIGKPVFTRRRASLPAPAWTSIKDVARERGLTPSVVLLSAYAAVLSRWSNQNDLTLNLTLFNRPDQPAHIDEVIGDFTSVSLLEVTAESGDTFGSRAERLQRQFLRDLEHVGYSGVRVLRDRARHLGDGPGAAMPIVFTSGLVLAGDEHTEPAEAFFGEYAGGVSQTPQVWLDHQVTEERGALLFQWDAVEELFPAGLLDDAFTAYRELLERLGGGIDWDGPDAETRLPAWQIEERRRTLATHVDISPRTLGDLFSAQVKTSPYAPAVIADDRTLTYEQLESEANRLAHRLIALDAGPNTLVAIVLEKGWQQIAAALGVVLAGAAYLPIDPQWPEARRHRLLATARARIAVTSPGLRSDLAWPESVHPVTFDDPIVRAAPHGPPAREVLPEDLAYVIFTSGSTGQPKGVMIDHRGASNTIQDINRRFAVGAADRCLALSALSFDLSVYDIFGILAAGGTVVMPSPAGVSDPGHWTDLVRRHGVTIWNSVPALMKVWLDNGSVAADSLRLCLLSGDWIPVDLPGAVHAVAPDAAVISLGGATEASIWSVAYPIGHVPSDWVRIPYGKPLANQTLHIYTDRLDECPVWTVGEIYIGGIGIAQGYWADPVRTAERFMTHPHTGERLYRTGDLGRYLPGGDIEFLGRADFQVKLNGYRIELGEIEAALRNQSGVADALVQVDTHPATGHRHLVAYVVPHVADVAAGNRSEPPAGWAEIVAAGTAELSVAAAELDGDLDTFRSWWQRVEAICPDIMARTLARLGAFTSDGDTCTVADVAARSGTKQHYTGLIDRWMAALAAAGRLRLTELPGEYRCIEAFDVEALDRRITETLDAIRVDGVHAVFLDYLRASVDNQIELLHGTVSPLQLLLPDGGSRVVDALYARNPMAQIQNRVTAAVVATAVGARAAAGHDARDVRILEIGAGTGSTSAAVLPALPTTPLTYRFTDLSTFFTDQARRLFADFRFVEYGLLDVDRDPAEQGVAPGSIDVIIAANVLHDATDLPRTLAWLRTALSAHGVLVLIEGTANSLIQLVTVGFIEGFSQDHGGLALPLMPVAQWREKLASAGFVACAALPDGEPVVDAMAQHVLVAAAPDQATICHAADLKAALDRELPEYLVPQHYHTIDHIPLSANGKVDRSALPSPWTGAAPSVPVAPGDPTELVLHGIWQEALGQRDFGADDNFFELGGDSLHAIRILVRIREEFGIDLAADDGLQLLFDSPTIVQLAKALNDRLSP